MQNNDSGSALTAAADRPAAADRSAAERSVFRRSINPDTAGYSHEECLSGI